MTRRLNLAEFYQLYSWETVWQITRKCHICSVSCGKTSHLSPYEKKGEQYFRTYRKRCHWHLTLKPASAIEEIIMITMCWNKSLGSCRYKCSYVKTKLCSFLSFPVCSNPPRVTSPWGHPGMYMDTVLTMCTPLILKSISKQIGYLDTFLYHSSSWNTRCGRVVALQKVYKIFFQSLPLFFSPLVWGKEKNAAQRCGSFIAYGSMNGWLQILLY